MSKSFTCRELMGVCDQKVSGDTFMEIVQRGMQHMQSDGAHQEHLANLAKHHTKENKEKWFAEMQQIFDAKPHDN